ncbi:MAG TPA: glycosyltransferase [Acidimicrobiales bacterium]|nr:glycosyltransferase [Acidimicrobiales bacterium]
MSEPTAAGPVHTRRPKVVLLGMLAKLPVGGVIWLVRQYAIGFERLGFDVYYVEAHGRVPSMLMDHEDDDATAKAVAFVAGQMRQLGMGDRWAFHALHDDRRCYGMAENAVHRLYREAALIVNLHGGTVPTEEQAATGRLVYMGTDPVEVELELHRGEQRAVDFLDPHVAFFTWGLNYGNPDCRLPWSERFPFVPSPPPVVVDLWQDAGDDAPATAFTTVGNWRQPWRTVRFQGEVYTWSKHHEFAKILDLPSRVDQTFELALSSYRDEDRRLLEGHGWRVRPAGALSADAERYRDYVAGSRGELTAAKDQNVRLRTGWFSERSATYLASGRPVIQQDTGFGNAVPTGTGLFGFSEVDDAAAAVEAINRDYAAHRRAASEIAREFFNYDVVLTHVLDHVGVDAPRRPRQGHRRTSSGHPLGLSAGGRLRLPLPEEVVGRVLSRPVPALWARRPRAPLVSIVLVTSEDLTVTRLALESLLANTVAPSFEVIVVDNASPDGTREYLSVLAARNRNVHVVGNEDQLLPAAANVQGLEAARGEILVLVGHRTVFTPGWLERLTVALAESAEGVAAAPCRSTSSPSTGPAPRRRR